MNSKASSCTTVFNIGNHVSEALNHYRMISVGSCDTILTKKIHIFITEINYILKYIKMNSYVK